MLIIICYFVVVVALLFVFGSSFSSETVTDISRRPRRGRHCAGRTASSVRISGRRCCCVSLDVLFPLSYIVSFVSSVIFCALPRLAECKRISLAALSGRRPSSRRDTQTAGPSLDAAADIFELCSKSLTLATPTSFTTRPIMQACWLSLLHRFGNRCKHHCSRLLAIFCGGMSGGYGLLARNISICLLNTSIMVCSCGWSRFTMSAM